MLTNTSLHPMTNGHGIETPANKISTSQAVLGLAIRLHAEVLAGRIDESLFKRDVRVITGGNGLKLPADSNRTAEDLRLGSFNLVLVALSASALTADETLGEVFGKLGIETERSRLGIRVMVNQLRNAFAHNPWRPRWVVYPQHRGTYVIVLDDGSTFTFDATNLNGEGVKPEQVGGLEFWVKLLQHCERLVAR